MKRWNHVKLLYVTLSTKRKQTLGYLAWPNSSVRKSDGLQIQGVVSLSPSCYTTCVAMQFLRAFAPLTPYTPSPDSRTVFGRSSNHPRFGWRPLFQTERWCSASDVNARLCALCHSWRICIVHVHCSREF